MGSNPTISTTAKGAERRLLLWWGRCQVWIRSRSDWVRIRRRPARELVPGREPKRITERSELSHHLHRAIAAGGGVMLPHVWVFQCPFIPSACHA